MISKRIALCSAGVVLLALPRAGLGQSVDMAGLLDKAAPSIVTVKVVIKTEFSMMGQAQNDESRSELQGVVVDDSGLVMISNAEISADRVKEAMTGNPMMGNVDITMTPTDFKVIFGNEEDEYDAFLVAKDTKLDLAFLQVQGITDRTLTTISFAEGAKPVVGDTVVAVSRLKKGFDYAPFVSTALVSGTIRKPRKAWIIDGNINSYGLPVFSTSGDIVGVLITLTPTTTDDSGGSGFGSMMRMFRGGGIDSSVGTFVLPAKIVNRLIKQSRAKVQELLDEQETDG